MKLKPHFNKHCKACGLYLNQLPRFEIATNAHVFWVGLSAVQYNGDIKSLPLSSNTRSGNLLQEIESSLTDEVNFYKTNLVKCLPLNNGKIRYPLVHEMEKCFPNFEEELSSLKPSIVFLLGKQVSSFVMKKENVLDLNLSKSFNYKVVCSRNIVFVPIHHPSYILIYKRKAIHQYIKSIRLLIRKYSILSTGSYGLAS